jgi:hypothetical protein
MDMAVFLSTASPRFVHVEMGSLAGVIDLPRSYESLFTKPSRSLTQTSPSPSRSLPQPHPRPFFSHAQVVCPLVTEGNPQRIPFLPPSAAIWDVNGRGNNWAWGYSNAASRLGLGGGVAGASSSSSTAAGAGGGGGAGRSAGVAAGKKKGAGAAPLLDRALNAIRKHVSADAKSHFFFPLFFSSSSSHAPQKASHPCFTLPNFPLALLCTG